MRFNPIDSEVFNSDESESTKTWVNLKQVLNPNHYDLGLVLAIGSDKPSSDSDSFRLNLSKADWVRLVFDRLSLDFKSVKNHTINIETSTP